MAAVSRSPRHDPDHPTHAPGSAIPGATVDAVRDLTLDLIGAFLPAIGTDHNTVCSGYGLWCALAVLLAGSDEDTAKSLSLALRTDQAAVASGLGALDQRLHDVGGASHALAVWSRVPIDRTLRESLGMIEFGSGAEDTGLKPRVSAGTRGLIPPSTITNSLDTPHTGDTMLTFLDTACLVADWAEPFSRSTTKDQRFTRADGTHVDVPTMGRSFGRNESFAVHGAGPNQRTTVVSLFCRPVVPRFAGSGAMDAMHAMHAMDAMDAVDAMDAMANSDGGSHGIAQAQLRVALGPPDMTAMAVVHDLLANSHTRIDSDRVDVRLPRFTTRSHHDLAGPLESMGLGDLFRANVDLSRLSPEPLVLSHATQQVVVEVGDQDRDVGAAIDTGAGALPPRESTIIDLAFDRPFAYALVDAELDLPILAGWVADPSATD